MYQVLTAVFPVKSEWLTLSVESGQTICAQTTALNLRLVVWEWNDEAKAKTVYAIYEQRTQLLPEDFGLPLAGGQRVENYLLALGLCLERIFKALDTSDKAYREAMPLLSALEQGFGKNHPLLLAKANTVEDFTKALETKGRLGRWL